MTQFVRRSWEATLEVKPQSIEVLVTEPIGHRSETRPTLVGSQPPIEMWHERVAGATTADAVCDGLLHNA